MNLDPKMTTCERVAKARPKPDPVAKLKAEPPKGRRDSTGPASPALRLLSSAPLLNHPDPFASSLHFQSSLHVLYPTLLLSLGTSWLSPT